MKIISSSTVTAPIGRTYLVHDDDAEGIRLRCRECPDLDLALPAAYPGDRTDGGVPTWNVWDASLQHVQDAHGGKPNDA